MNRNRKKEEMLTSGNFRKFVNYDATSGFFTWLERTWGAAPKRFNVRYAGTRAGASHVRGYRQIGLEGFGMFGEARLAWLYMTGKWPKDEIDHINGDPSDNRFANLREATSSENKANRRVQDTSRSGIKGVRFKNGKWLASVKKDGRSVHLGSFASAEAASAAFACAVKLVRGEFARHE